MDGNDTPGIDDCALPADSASAVDAGHGPNGRGGPAVGGALSTFRPTEGQQRAIDVTAEVVKRAGRQLIVIRGYAGVGKTTMLRVFGSLFGTPTVVTPTGKAALRVTEATGLHAQTIHRWLYHVGVDGKGRVGFKKKHAADLVVGASKLLLIDEASMVGPDIWNDVWEAAGALGLKVVAVGDGFQLPPVTPGKASVDFSLLSDATIRRYGGVLVELTEVLRQAQDSPIIRASMGLRAGQGVQALSELPWLRAETMAVACRDCVAAGGVVIAHTNATRHRVNAGMRAMFGRHGLLEPTEPLLVLKNNYDLDLYNGEQVRFDVWEQPPNEPVHVIDKYTGAETDIRFGVARVDGRRVILAHDELSGDTGEVGGLAVQIASERFARAGGHYADGGLVPYLSANHGYCYTAHKSQGSEWPYAVVLLEPTVKLGKEDGRRWAYTAVTRAKEAVAVFAGKLP